MISGSDVCGTSTPLRGRPNTRTDRNHDSSPSMPARHGPSGISWAREGAVHLTEILPVLEALAPLGLAEEWDNVGLLLEGEREIDRILCTIDLTAGVLDEAL